MGMQTQAERGRKLYTPTRTMSPSDKLNRELRLIVWRKVESSTAATHDSLVAVAPGHQSNGSIDVENFPWRCALSV